MHFTFDLNVVIVKIILFNYQKVSFTLGIFRFKTLELQEKKMVPRFFIGVDTLQSNIRRQRLSKNQL